MLQTVSELIKSTHSDKIWLCPHIVHRPTFRSNTLLRGIECTRSSVPQRLMDMTVSKYFKEGGFLCIIWNNDITTENTIKLEEEKIPDSPEGT